MANEPKERNRTPYAEKMAAIRRHEKAKLAVQAIVEREKRQHGEIAAARAKAHAELTDAAEVLKGFEA